MQNRTGAVHNALRVEWMNEGAHPASVAGVAKSLPLRVRRIEVDPVGRQRKGIAAGCRPADSARCKSATRLLRHVCRPHSPSSWRNSQKRSSASAGLGRKRNRAVTHPLSSASEKVSAQTSGRAGLPLHQIAAQRQLRLTGVKRRSPAASSSRLPRNSAVRKRVRFVVDLLRRVNGRSLTCELQTAARSAAPGRCRDARACTWTNAHCTRGL